MEGRLNLEYQDFLEFQSKLVGKLKREEPELPTDELDIDKELEALIQAAETKELERIRRGVEERARDASEEGDTDDA